MDVYEVRVTCSGLPEKQVGDNFRMLHVLILRYVAPADEVAPHIPDHIAYLEKHHSHGVFLFSGRTVPADLGGIVLARGARGEVEAAVAEDPFVRNGVAAYEIVSADAGIVHPDLNVLLSSPPASPTTLSTSPPQWTLREYRGLRPDAAGLDTVLSEENVRAVSHRAGTAVLAALRAGAPGLVNPARGCASELRDRDWPGDGLLADELDRALAGKDAGAELTPVSADLEELVAVLGSDPNEGDGAFDPMTGEILSTALLEFESGLDVDASAEDRRIVVEPDSRSAYQDMADFAETVDAPDLRECLRRALDGRGAFARFKDAIHRAGGDDLTAWTIFEEERALGRARRWLADHGYRPNERTALG